MILARWLSEKDESVELLKKNNQGLPGKGGRKRGAGRDQPLL